MCYYTRSSDLAKKLVAAIQLLLLLLLLVYMLPNTGL
jgi:hypothetical protein